ncbi:hypothetical protein A3G67_04260 [Candidatus Roizmanbacteria bacterium RIFCSPLOWO2_12_FULL_40_12]|uniref:Methyltransferase type 11 domain-containing protein n=1 Tax=Candidatus Roizmanbacteria bacterium RIFCSPLOWO2_01_FULL_40_42 TaxID=1802066 RepID=A0A1F7J6M8_9BACT|nr:MAG: hypothetical protein A2779_00630 [Candidatus Roizmanbacteria bacterium RIFCSPHIGHO2_01_FULL_40_98]OGK29153.1 MAG: hypothetical protein A3C31_02605 [Candidatus Roizmanbacteria bacterium RIFCSPHIGHO2_02_FULL_40_53]OGK30720.1 MAG: hypothetical protein A2W49_01825 [Candidatus Roizmanbacteria bacterium RIFCSPHIGHO2_12_41_18]OGK37189.1 MAG: hypothetical protein A3E69_01815 [Candidatus Roizmanbacteria bacterium RIFCSPHIGHO2_12_FULL_40_130]OGK51263.1 MAG: hypothetical protein A3B50_04690 [Candi
MQKHLRVVVEIIASEIPHNRHILEIGSLQTQGQKELTNLRTLFINSKYIGIDLRDGAGVDVVANAESLPFSDKTFDLVLCLETLEHAEKPWIITKEIERVMNPRGICIVSSQQNFPIHKHPSDYFRYTPFGLSILFKSLKEKMVVAISPPFDKEVELNPQTVILVGSKQNVPKVFKNIRRKLESNKDKISIHKPYRHRLFDGLRFVRRGFQEVFYKLDVKFYK